MKGVATGESFHCQPTPFNKAKSFERDNRILRARWHVSARGREQWRDKAPVYSNTSKGENLRDVLDVLGDVVLFRHRRPRLSSRPSITPALTRQRLHCDSKSADPQVAVSLRATKTTSLPGQGAPALRAASRRTLFDLFLTGADPSFFPATKATLPAGALVPSGVGSARTITDGQEAFTPLVKILSMSCLDLTVFFMRYCVVCTCAGDALVLIEFCPSSLPRCVLTHNVRRFGAIQRKKSGVIVKRFAPHFLPRAVCPSRLPD